MKERSEKKPQVRLFLGVFNAGSKDVLGEGKIDAVTGEGNRKK